MRLLETKPSKICFGVEGFEIRVVDVLLYRYYGSANFDPMIDSHLVQAIYYLGRICWKFHRTMIAGTDIVCLGVERF